MAPGQYGAHQHVVVGQQVGAHEGVRAGERQVHFHRLYRLRHRDIHGRLTLQLLPHLVHQALHCLLSLKQLAFDLDQAPVRPGVVCCSTLPDRPKHGAEAQQAEDRRLATFGAPTVDQALCLAGLDLQ